jgi:hypothetical protein
VRVFFGEEPPAYDVLWQAGRIPGRRMKEFLRIVSENRARLFEEWDLKVKVVDP